MGGVSNLPGESEGAAVDIHLPADLIGWVNYFAVDTERSLTPVVDFSIDADQGA
jgi:hypothetical protein